MDDKELLEKAAKAVGLDGYIHEWINGPEFIIHGENPATWNPLTDDGDALRLAVKIGLEVFTRQGMSGDITTVAVPQEMDIESIHERHKGDAMKATRLAITRAAAAMAR